MVIFLHLFTVLLSVLIAIFQYLLWVKSWKLVFSSLLPHLIKQREGFVDELCDEHNKICEFTIQVEAACLQKGTV